MSIRIKNNLSLSVKEYRVLHSAANFMINNSTVFFLIMFVSSLFAFAFSSTALARESYVFNMQDVDIRTMISTVSDVTGKNFIIDPNVKGKVTVISKKSMSENEVYHIFLSLLDVHGYSVVPTIEPNTFKIIKGFSA